MASRFILTTLAVAGVCLAASLLASTRTAPARPAVARSAPAPASDGIRIRYRDGAYPVLTLPDGRRETIRSVLNVGRPMGFGSYVWNEEGAPAGEVWVRVDIDAQLISVFRAGHEIGSAVILYGAESKPTPTGVFPVLQKARDYHSYTYDAPMPYMLRLTADGVAIHASDVKEGWATHGCIGVPMEFARRLYGLMRLGDRVAIVNGSPRKDPVISVNG